MTAVRTETAKLIRYPGHDDWTELFDLAADPYETRNLFGDPGHAALRRELEAEYGRQEAAIGFRIPAFADDPTQDSSGAAMNAWVLEYDFDQDAGDEVVDATGRANHGQARGAPLVDGRDGHQARRFDGTGSSTSPVGEPEPGGRRLDGRGRLPGPERTRASSWPAAAATTATPCTSSDGKPALTVVVRRPGHADRRPAAGRRRLGPGAGPGHGRTGSCNCSSTASSWPRAGSPPPSGRRTRACRSGPTSAARCSRAARRPGSWGSSSRSGSTAASPRRRSRRRGTRPAMAREFAEMPRAFPRAGADDSGG